MSERCPCCGHVISTPYGKVFAAGPFAGLPSGLASRLIREGVHSREEAKSFIAREVVNFWGEPIPWWREVQGFGPKSAAIVEQWVNK